MFIVISFALKKKRKKKEKKEKKKKNSGFVLETKSLKTVSISLQRYEIICLAEIYIYLVDRRM